MGLRGPAGKREEDRLGHTRAAAAAMVPVEKIEFEKELKVLPPNPAWEDIATFAYEAFLDSPLNQYYAQTDIAFGWMAAQAIHEAIVRPSSTKTMAAESMMKTAMFSESDRRRVRIEITRKEPDKNPVADKNVTDFQARRQQRSR